MQSNSSKKNTSKKNTRKPIFPSVIKEFFPPVIKEYNKKWVHKATFTVFVSQLGLFILLLFIGPSNLFEPYIPDEPIESKTSEMNQSVQDSANTQTSQSQEEVVGYLSFFNMWGKILIDYLQKGSLLLSIMSLGANAAANYFWDSRKDKEDSLLFETNKLPFIICLSLVFSAGIVYGVLPDRISFYFINLQFFMFCILIIYIYKINHAIFTKEQTYKEEVHIEQESVVTGTINLSNKEYGDDVTNLDAESSSIPEEEPAFADSPGKQEEVPAFAKSPSKQEEEPAFADSPGKQEEEPAFAKSPNKQEEEPAFADAPGKQEEEPAFEDAPGKQEEEPAFADAPGKQEGEPAFADAPGKQEEEPAFANSPGK